MESCATCKYFGEEDGICRRFPPTRLMFGPASVTQFPKVKSSEWCGEFVAKQEEPT